MPHSILIVDDEEDIRNLVKGILEDEGYKIYTAANSSEAYQVLAEQGPHLVVLDIWLQGSQHDGLQILEQSTEKYPHIPIIMISGHGTIETAVAAIKQGAYDFIEKPFKSDRLLLMVRRALETAALKRENLLLKRQAQEPIDIIGKSQFVKNLQDVLKRVCAANSRVLLSGEPGTGKGIVARYIHQHSERAEQPFLSLNCATIDPDQLEQELFGDADVTGVLEAADQGTLFLDEISEMPLDVQGKFLRAIQEQKFRKPGLAKDVVFDVRIIAAGNRDLKKAVEAGVLREDLYYRLNVVALEMLPLRERMQDIQYFADHFLTAMFDQAGLVKKTIDPQAMRVIEDYEWPGNIRQLKNVLEWMIIMHGGGDDQEFKIQHLPPEVSGEEPAAGGSDVLTLKPQKKKLISDEIMALSLRDAREEFERAYLMEQVRKFEGNISKTAEFVGMERSALHRKIKSLQRDEEDAGEARPLSKQTA